MSLSNLLSQFTQPSGAQDNAVSTASNPVSAITAALPGGLAGGAAAGGMVALLMGSKSARKMAGSAAKIGGTAVLGGLAYKAFTNWKQGSPIEQTHAATPDDIKLSQCAMPAQTDTEQPIDLTLIKTMISAAKSDGHIDPKEQIAIFEAVEKGELNTEEKAAVFDAMSREISVDEIASLVHSEEHKAEVYLSAFLAIEVDSELERNYLIALEKALKLPAGLSNYIEQQAKQGFQQAIK